MNHFNCREMRVRAFCLLLFAAAIIAKSLYAADAPSCASAENPDFVATFDWSSRIKHLENVEIRASQDGATFWVGHQCISTCRLYAAQALPKRLRRIIAELQPGEAGRDYVDFDCESVTEAGGPPGFMGPATLFFHPPLHPMTRSMAQDGAPFNGPMIRFGTWLRGYQRASLRVRTNHLAEVDGFSKPEAL